MANRKFSNFYCQQDKLLILTTSQMIKAINLRGAQDCASVHVFFIFFALTALKHSDDNPDKYVLSQCPQYHIMN